MTLHPEVGQQGSSRASSRKRTGLAADVERGHITAMAGDVQGVMQEVGSDDRIDAMLRVMLRGPARELSPPLTGDAGLVAQRARYHGVSHLLFSRLAGQGSHWSELAAALRPEALQQIAWEETHRRALVPLVRALAEAGIDAVLMKGTAIAYQLYDAPESRRRGDTDLLVSERQKERAVALMLEMGMRPKDRSHGIHYQQEWYLQPGDAGTHTVDVHWHANDAPTLQRVVPDSAMFANPIALPRLCEGAFAPDPVLSLLQCVINQAWHERHGYTVEGQRVVGGARLIWDHDVHLLSRTLDEDGWQRLVAAAINNGMAGLVLRSLSRATADFGSELPAPVETALSNETSAGVVERYLLEMDRSGRLKEDLRSIRSPVARARFLLEAALPSAGHLRRKYPDQAHWPHAVLLLRWLTNTMRRARGEVAS